MLSLKLIKKLSGGAVGPDEIAELLSSMGIDFEVTHADPEAVPELFRDAAVRTLKPGAEVITLSGRLKNGDRMDALMIVQPKPVVGVARIEQITHDALHRFDLAADPNQRSN